MPVGTGLLPLSYLNEVLPHTNILLFAISAASRLPSAWMDAIGPSKINLTTQAHANLVFWAEMGTEGLVTEIIEIFYDLVLFWNCLH